MHQPMKLKQLIVGEIANLREKINRGECEKVKRHIETNTRDK